jgi:hypothetical protein
MKVTPESFRNIFISLLSGNLCPVVMVKDLTYQPVLSFYHRVFVQTCQEKLIGANHIFTFPKAI